MDQCVVIGSDHAGFAVKEYLVGRLSKAGFTVEDMGTHGEAPADFAPIARRVAENVAAHAGKQGILLCGTGIGMSIMANKVKGVRAALVHDLFSAKATRAHNDTNVLCMGARVVAPEMAWEIAVAWLREAFLGGKHARRVAYIAAYENGENPDGEAKANG